MLDCITAISTALTAVFAALTYFIVRRQMAISKPVINFNTSVNTLDDFISLSVDIAKPDDEKFKLERLLVTNPPTGRVAKKVSDSNNRAAPGDWKIDLEIDYFTSSTGVFVTAPRGSKVEILVHICLKSDVSVKSRLPISINMHD